MTPISEILSASLLIPCYTLVQTCKFIDTLYSKHKQQPKMQLQVQYDIKANVPSNPPESPGWSGLCTAGMLEVLQWQAHECKDVANVNF